MENISREEYWYCVSKEILNSVMELPNIDNCELQILRLSLMKNLALLLSSEDTFNNAMDVLAQSQMQQQNPILKLVRK